MRNHPGNKRNLWDKKLGAQTHYVNKPDGMGQFSHLDIQ
ncbi:hypothetical protein Metal_1756 [Methylomicrobium album BG8]|uniref:Uncharacterized protein n=1 Tax=Methylomicrobium album BG8 TaxID=686340 RepID=H8GMX3_METAL|nr:hypothetical protein Metal_1756 [Methylomicrobium album BG8]